MTRSKQQTVCLYCLATAMAVIFGSSQWGWAQTAWPPDGKAMRLEVSRDTWVSSAGGEADGNNGGASRLKTKGIQEFSILDMDTKSLTGQIVVGATLHFHVESPEFQRRLTVSTLATEWVEGTGSSYAIQKGSACFNWAAQGERRWAYRNSDITAVFGGLGNTIWRFAEPTAPDKDGWQVVPVDPQIVAARVAGVSKGFVLFDDVGSEYTRDGTHFKFMMFPNRFLASREQKSHAPYWTIYVRGTDNQPPPAVGAMGQEPPSEFLRPGEALVSWITPHKDGPAPVIGFLVRAAEGADVAWDKATDVPQYLVPMAPVAGGQVNMLVRDLPFKPGAVITLGVRAVDRCGNIGPVATCAVKLADSSPVKIVGPSVKPFDDVGALPAAGGVEVSIIDPLDTVNTVSDQVSGGHAASYRQANHLWSAAQKLIRLHGARNEAVAFQIVLAGKADALEVKVDFPGDGGATPIVELSRFMSVPIAGGTPDPLVPVSGKLSIPAADEKIAGQKSLTLLADVYVPHDAKAGVQRGTLQVKNGDALLVIPIELHVWDFSLPDHLSFVPELNCYGLPEGQEIAYYRLAHKNRANLTRLAYNWKGGVRPEWSPAWKDGKFDWTVYDRNAGPLLDGSAFADLPRKNVPVHAMYLPINENFPVSIDKGFTSGYWADEALTPEYRAAFVEAAAQIARHFKEKAWTGTLVELYLNNKVYFKKDDWNRSSAPWCFDEPTNTQDFWALRWYGQAFHEGVDPNRGDARLVFRCDISRPQWQREILDGVVDVDIIGGEFRQYNRMIMDRKARLGDIMFNYGSSNPVGSSNIQPVVWSLDTWTLGGDGVEPWQTIGNAKSWQGDKSDEAIFYPGEAIGLKGPIPSVRLKAYTRGEQDVEYLVLLCRALKQPRWAVADAVRQAFNLGGSVHQKDANDAGLVSYDKMDVQSLWELRMRIGAMLDAAKPLACQELVDFKIPVRNPKTLPDLGYVTVAPPH